MSDFFSQVRNFFDSITDSTTPIDSPEQEPEPEPEQEPEPEPEPEPTPPAMPVTSTMTDTNSETDNANEQQGEQTPPVLTIDGVAYDFNSLSDRARMLSVDFVRTDQEWNALQHRYRQFVAMEVTYVNSLKQEVEKANLEPVYTSDAEKSEVPLLTIDQVSYDASKIPDAVRIYVEDLVRNNQERGQLEFRLRQLDAARSAFLGVIRQELKESDANPLDPQPEAANTDGEQHDNHDNQ